MQQDELTLRRRLRLMLIDDDGIAVVDSIEHALGGKPDLIDLTRPEVTRDGREMRIRKERLKSGLQVPILATGQGVRDRCPAKTAERASGATRSCGSGLRTR